MSLITVDELLVPLTEDQIFDRLIANAEALSFPVTDWEEGGVARTFFRIYARDMAKFATMVPLVVAAGYLDTAEGFWLDLLGISRFGETRNPAISTEGIFVFATASGTSVAIQPGSHVIQYGGVRFRTNATLTIGSASSANVPMIAESPGSAGNLSNSVALQQVTQTSGLTVTNPIYSGGTWITVPGQDEESDPAYRTRCKLKFATLTSNGPSASYEAWARKADGSVRRVQVGSLVSAFTFPVYIAGSTSTALPGSVVTTVQAYINALKPQAAVPTVTLASTQSLGAIAITFITTTSDPISIPQIQAGAQAWLDALPIGGEKINGSSKFWNARFCAAVKALSSSAKLVTATPGDTFVSAGNIVTASSITVTLLKE